MINKPFKHFRHSLASLSLLTATGCASLLGTDYREEYAQLPEPPKQQMTVEQTPVMPSTISRPEFSGEFADEMSQSDAVLEGSPGGSPWPTADQTQNESDVSLAFNDDAYITDEVPMPADPKLNGSLHRNENPFVEFERDQTQQASGSEEGLAVVRLSDGPKSTDAQQNPFAQSAASAQEYPVQSSNAHGIARVSASSSTSASTFRAAEPRLPGNQPGCPPASSVTVAATQHVQAYPDEYIFDGGDRNTPVHYFGADMAGLDTEDTVAEFKDHTGEKRVTASNRVAVYAPRFGAVETVTGPGIDVKVDQAAGARDVSGIGALHEQRGMNINVAATPASGVAVRSGAGGVETAQPAHVGRKTDRLAENSRVDQGFESKTARGLGLLEISDVHELNLQILEPATSNIKTFVGQRASTSQATQTYAMFRLASMTGSEEGGIKGAIHITKEASPLVAQSGDIVTFTIHFKNTGDYNVDEVRIIDNLTPRLRFVEDSGELKLPDGGEGGLTRLPNKDGGQLLQFELDQPLKGGQSGTISFKAKVL